MGVVIVEKARIYTPAGLIVEDVDRLRQPILIFLSTGWIEFLHSHFHQSVILSDKKADHNIKGGMT